MCPCMTPLRRELFPVCAKALEVRGLLAHLCTEPPMQALYHAYWGSHITMPFWFLPFNILTATVLQVAVLSIPKASASITWPKAPRPRGFPRINDNGNYKSWLLCHTIRGLCEDSNWLRWCCIPFRPIARFTFSFWLFPSPSRMSCFEWLYGFLTARRLYGWIPKVKR